MKTLLFLSVLLSLLSSFQIPAVNNDGSPMTVTSFKWSRARQKVDVPEAQGNPPASAMIPQNRNFSRNARVNDPQGVRDPNQDTLDGRSAAMEKSVAESRAARSKTMDGYLYRIKVLINRVEYSDGSIWQRKDWNLGEVKGSYERVLREQWVPGTCKGL